MYKDIFQVGAARQLSSPSCVYDCCCSSPAIGQLRRRFEGLDRRFLVLNENEELRMKKKRTNIVRLYDKARNAICWLVEKKMGKKERIKGTETSRVPQITHRIIYIRFVLTLCVSPSNGTFQPSRCKSFFFRIFMGLFTWSEPRTFALYSPNNLSPPPPTSLSFSLSLFLLLRWWRWLCVCVGLFCFSRWLVCCWESYDHFPMIYDSISTLDSSVRSRTTSKPTPKRIDGANKLPLLYAIDWGGHCDEHAG